VSSPKKWVLSRRIARIAKSFPNRNYGELRMPWLIGIDEAGYGPNLGPLVQSSVAVQVADAEANLWDLLGAVVRRVSDKADRRLLVDDSKRVNQGTQGFVRLERGVLTALASDLTLPCLLGDLLKRIGSEDSRSELLREAWFDVTMPLPIEVGAESVLAAGRDLRSGILATGAELGTMSAVITPVPRFNSLLDKWGNKSAVLADGVIGLLQANRRLPGAEPLVYLIDKLGGRNFYAAMISTAFSDGWVVAEREGPEICSYRIIGIEREIRLVFQPRADGSHFAVALASMVSKYLREVFMKQFNRWWIGHVPGIKPTAGYPVDAARFMKQIRGKMKALGFDESAIWRRK
jgi:ribonuclease HII